MKSFRYRNSCILLRRFTALAAAIALSLSDTAACAQQPEPGIRPRPGTGHSTPLDPSALSVPASLGTLESFHQGTADKTVILIRDAHAVPAAQASISGLIHHFQAEYGVRLAGMEGAASKLDPGILETFPDDEAFQKVIGGYHSRGELPGAVSAALSSARESSFPETAFYGIEEWPLYEKGLAAYLEALKREQKLSEWHRSAARELAGKKEKIYSKELLEADRVIMSFYEDETNVVEALSLLSRIQPPPAGSRLSDLLSEAARQGPAGAPAAAEVKRAAVIFEKSLEALPYELRRGELRRFQEKYQAFRTSGLAAPEFVLYMEETAERLGGGLRLPVSGGLRGRMRSVKRIRDMEGTELLAEFEHYAASIKEALFTNDGQRELDKVSAKLELLARLIRLELSLEDWRRAEGLVKSGDALFSGEDLSAHLSFYLIAMQRDEAFFRRMTSLLKETGASSAVLVAGGFHAQSLIEKFEAEGLSYALVTPSIGALPEETLYREHMKGNVSWKDYYAAENGRIDLYQAFMRSARDRLLAASGKDKGRLLKIWRDEIIRGLYEEGRIHEARKYTRYIDEATGGPENGAAFQAGERLHRFIEGLKKLEAKGPVTGADILGLVKPSGMIEPVTGIDPALSLPESFAGGAMPYEPAAALSELRSEGFPGDGESRSLSELRSAAEAPQPPENGLLEALKTGAGFQPGIYPVFEEKSELISFQRGLSGGGGPITYVMDPLPEPEIVKFLRDPGMTELLNRWPEDVNPELRDELLYLRADFFKPQTRNGLVNISRVRFASPWAVPVNEESGMIHAYYFAPVQARPGPAVIIPSFITGDFYARALSIYLSSKGTAVLEMHLPMYGSRTPFGAGVLNSVDRYLYLDFDDMKFRNFILQGIADSIAAGAWLRSRPEVDPGRVTIAGFSVAGSIAQTAFQIDAGFSRSAVLAPTLDYADLIWGARRYEKFRDHLEGLRIKKENFRAALKEVSPGSAASVFRRDPDSMVFGFVSNDELVPVEGVRAFASLLGNPAAYFEAAGSSEEESAHFTGSIGLVPKIILKLMELNKETGKTSGEPDGQTLSELRSEAEKAEEVPGIFERITQAAGIRPGAAAALLAAAVLGVSAALSAAQEITGPEEAPAAVTAAQTEDLGYTIQKSGPEDEDFLRSKTYLNEDGKVQQSDLDLMGQVSPGNIDDSWRSEDYWNGRLDRKDEIEEPFDIRPWIIVSGALAATAVFVIPLLWHITRRTKERKLEAEIRALDAKPRVTKPAGYRPGPARRREVQSPVEGMARIHDLVQKKIHENLELHGGARKYAGIRREDGFSAAKTTIMIAVDGDSYDERSAFAAYLQRSLQSDFISPEKTGSRIRVERVDNLYGLEPGTIFVAVSSMPANYPQAAVVIDPFKTNRYEQNALHRLIAASFIGERSAGWNKKPLYYLPLMMSDADFFDLLVDPVKALSEMSAFKEPGRYMEEPEIAAALFEEAREGQRPYLFEMETAEPIWSFSTRNKPSGLNEDAFTSVRLKRIWRYERSGFSPVHNADAPESDFALDSRKMRRSELRSGEKDGPVFDAERFADHIIETIRPYTGDRKLLSFEDLNDFRAWGVPPAEYFPEGRPLSRAEILEVFRIIKEKTGASDPIWEEDIDNVLSKGNVPPQRRELVLFYLAAREMARRKIAESFPGSRLIYLARDGLWLALLDYFHGRRALESRPSSLYLPGYSPYPAFDNSSQALDFKRVFPQLTDKAQSLLNRVLSETAALPPAERSGAAAGKFITEFNDWLDQNQGAAEFLREILSPQIERLSLREGEPLVLYDTFGSGKSLLMAAAFIKRLYPSLKVDVLLTHSKTGRKSEHRFPALADEFLPGMMIDEPFWPFEFRGFNAETSLPEFMLLDFAVLYEWVFLVAAAYNRSEIGKDAEALEDAARAGDFDELAAAYLFPPESGEERSAEGAALASRLGELVERLRQRVMAAPMHTKKFDPEKFSELVREIEEIEIALGVKNEEDFFTVEIEGVSYPVHPYRVDVEGGPPAASYQIGIAELEVGARNKAGILALEKIIFEKMRELGASRPAVLRINGRPGTGKTHISRLIKKGIAGLTEEEILLIPTDDYLVQASSGQIGVDMQRIIQRLRGRADKIKLIVVEGLDSGKLFEDRPAILKENDLPKTADVFLFVRNIEEKSRWERIIQRPEGGIRRAVQLARTEIVRSILYRYGLDLDVRSAYLVIDTSLSVNGNGERETRSELRPSPGALDDLPRRDRTELLRAAVKSRSIDPLREEIRLAARSELDFYLYRMTLRKLMAEDPAYEKYERVLRKARGRKSAALIARILLERTLAFQFHKKMEKLLAQKDGFYAAYHGIIRIPEHLVFPERASRIPSLVYSPVPAEEKGPRIFFNREFFTGRSQTTASSDDSVWETEQKINALFFGGEDPQFLIETVRAAARAPSLEKSAIQEVMTAEIQSGEYQTIHAAAVTLRDGRVIPFALVMARDAGLKTRVTEEDFRNLETRKGSKYLTQVIRFGKVRETGAYSAFYLNSLGETYFERRGERKTGDVQDIVRRMDHYGLFRLNTMHLLWGGAFRPERTRSVFASMIKTFVYHSDLENGRIPGGFDLSRGDLNLMKTPYLPAFEGRETILHEDIAEPEFTLITWRNTKEGVGEKEFLAYLFSLEYLIGREIDELNNIPRELALGLLDGLKKGLIEKYGRDEGLKRTKSLLENYDYEKAAAEKRPGHHIFTRSFTEEYLRGEILPEIEKESIAAGLSELRSEAEPSGRRGETEARGPEGTEILEKVVNEIVSDWDAVRQKGALMLDIDKTLIEGSETLRDHPALMKALGTLIRNGLRVYLITGGYKEEVLSRAALPLLEFFNNEWPSNLFIYTNIEKGGPNYRIERKEGVFAAAELPEETKGRVLDRVIEQDGLEPAYVYYLGDQFTSFRRLTGNDVSVITESRFGALKVLSVHRASYPFVVSPKILGKLRFIGEGSAAARRFLFMLQERIASLSADEISERSESSSGTGMEWVRAIEASLDRLRDGPDPSETALKGWFYLQEALKYFAGFSKYSKPGWIPEDLPFPDEEDLSVIGDGLRAYWKKRNWDAHFGSLNPLIGMLNSGSHAPAEEYERTEERLDYLAGGGLEDRLLSEWASGVLLGIHLRHFSGHRENGRDMDNEFLRASARRFIPLLLAWPEERQKEVPYYSGDPKFTYRDLMLWALAVMIDPANHIIQYKADEFGDFVGVIDLEPEETIEKYLFGTPEEPGMFRGLPRLDKEGRPAGGIIPSGELEDLLAEILSLDESYWTSRGLRSPWKIATAHGREAADHMLATMPGRPFRNPLMMLAVPPEKIKPEVISITGVFSSFDARVQQKIGDDRFAFARRYYSGRPEFPGLSSRLGTPAGTGRSELRSGPDESSPQREPVSPIVYSPAEKQDLDRRIAFLKEGLDKASSDPAKQGPALEALKDAFNREVAPLKGDIPGFIEYLRSKEKAGPIQKMARREIARLMEVSEEQIFFIPRSERLLWGLAGVGKTRDVDGVQFNLTGKKGDAVRFVLIVSDLRGINMVITLIHEIAHLKQAMKIFRAKEDRHLYTVLMEGFQQELEREMLLRLGKEETAFGRLIRRFIDKAFEEPTAEDELMASIRGTRLRKPEGLEAKVNELLKNFISVRAYETETAFVDFLVKQAGREPVQVFFETGNIRDLRNSIGHVKFDMLRLFFRRWNELPNLDLQADDDIGQNAKWVSYNLAAKLIVKGPPYTRKDLQALEGFIGLFHETTASVLGKKHISELLIHRAGKDLPDFILALAKEYLDGDDFDAAALEAKYREVIAAAEDEKERLKSAEAFAARVAEMMKREGRGPSSGATPKSELRAQAETAGIPESVSVPLKFTVLFLSDAPIPAGLADKLADLMNVGRVRAEQIEETAEGVSLLMENRAALYPGAARAASDAAGELRRFLASEIRALHRRGITLGFDLSNIGNGTDEETAARWIRNFVRVLSETGDGDADYRFILSGARKAGEEMTRPFRQAGFNFTAGGSRSLEKPDGQEFLPVLQLNGGLLPPESFVRRIQLQLEGDYGREAEEIGMVLQAAYAVAAASARSEKEIAEFSRRLFEAVSLFREYGEAASALVEISNGRAVIRAGNIQRILTALAAEYRVREEILSAA